MSGRILNGRRVLSEVTRSLVEEREKHRISVSPNLGEHPLAQLRFVPRSDDFSDLDCRPPGNVGLSTFKKIYKL